MGEHCIHCGAYIPEGYGYICFNCKQAALEDDDASQNEENEVDE